MLSTQAATDWEMLGWGREEGEGKICMIFWYVLAWVILETTQEQDRQFSKELVDKSDKDGIFP